VKHHYPTPAIIARDILHLEGNRLISEAHCGQAAEAAGRKLAGNLILSIPVMARLLAGSACRLCNEPLSDLSRGCEACLPGKTSIQETFTRALTEQRDGEAKNARA